MTTIREQRLENKRLFAEYLNEFQTSDKFNSMLQKVGDGFKIVQYDACYKHQSLQILSYQFSSMGGSNDSRSISLSVAENYRSLSLELDHLAKTGLGVVISDKHNNVCLLAYVWDKCDTPKIIIQNENHHKRHEIHSAAYQNDKEYQRKILSQINKIKYGDVLQAGKIAVRPDLSGKGLFRFDVSTYIWSLLGYQFIFGLQTHPVTISIGNTISKLPKNNPLFGNIAWKRTSFFDFSDFVFRDGTSMQDCYKKLNDSKMDVAALKEKHSTIAVIFGYFDKSKKVTIKDVVNAFFIFTAANIKYSSKSKI